MRGDEYIREGHEQGDFESSGYLVFPVFAYIHSGIALSTSPFSCRWDSGQIGFAVLSRADILKEYGWKRITRERRERLHRYLQNELAEIQAYANGEVYGYIIEDEEGNEVESCWGFYSEDDCREQAEELRTYYQNKEAERIAAAIAAA